MHRERKYKRYSRRNPTYMPGQRRAGSLALIALAVSTTAVGVMQICAAEPTPSQQVSATAPMNCAALMSRQFAHTTLASAAVVSAGAFKSPSPELAGPPADFSKLPAFCRVVGSIHPRSDSDIRFELWLPIYGWNGKFAQTGNGGAAGSIVYSSLADPLGRGYAVANTDTGHQGGMGDFSWALEHPAKLVDYADRAVHELTIVGKAITAAAYGSPPVKSFWVGCSTGGRQGLMEAERYPQDYDAIVAGAPASNWVPLMSLAISIQRNLGGHDGLGFDKLAVLQNAAIAKCSGADGAKDRIIGEPSQCTFDPGTLQCRSGVTKECLTAPEVAAARRIYAGVVTKSGQVLIPGTGPGSEPLWAAYASPQFSIGTSYFRNVVIQDPKWDPSAFNVDVDVAMAQKADGGATAAMNPDLRSFIGHGGKLITYHGTTDGLIPYGNSLNYYRSVVSKLGQAKAADSVRFFPVSGMGHCSGGEGAFVVDWLGALEHWVNTGKAPDTLQGAHPVMPPGPPGMPQPMSTGFTRPICAYPSSPKYRGTGDARDAKNFSCTSP
jgi:feruloyl esterase